MSDDLRRAKNAAAIARQQLIAAETDASTNPIRLAQLRDSAEALEDRVKRLEGKQ